MIGEKIGVTCCCDGIGPLLSPLLITQVEDKDEDREEEEVHDGHSREDEDAYFRPETSTRECMEGGVGGQGIDG